MSNKDIGKEVSEESIFLECNVPKNFKDLDQTFRCPICASLFDKAVTIKECGHSFCSVCIRSYWVVIRSGIHRQKKACPICRTAISVMDIEKALVMNRSIQEGVKAFRQMLLNHYRLSKDRVEDSPSTRFQLRQRTSKRKASATTHYDHSTHGDKTYDFGNGSKSGDEEVPIKKKMESRNYARMKKRDLQRLCREFKISTSGSEQELIDRMRNYQNMWNAEVLHSIDPQKPSDIVAKLAKEEQAQRDEKKRAQMAGASNDKECMRKLNETMKSGNQKFTSGNATFDRELKANFEAMTAQLQSRMKKKVKLYTNNSVKISNIDESVEAAYCSSKNQSSHLVEESLSMTVPTASSIEMIDVESCSDMSGRGIRFSTIDMNQKPLSLPSSHSVESPKTKSSSPDGSSFNCHQSPSYRTKHYTTVPVIQRVVAKKSSGNKKKKTSPASSSATTRVGWGCGKCTFENKGVDYVCQMCGHRKSEF